MIHIHPQAEPSDGLTQQIIKDRNATLLFDLVRRLAPISRVELAKASGLSPATVTVLINELLQGGWLQETGTAAVPKDVRGRRPVALEVNGTRGVVATVEIIAAGYILSTYDIRLHKLGQYRSRQTARESGSVAAQLRLQLEALGLPEDRLLGIHLLYPGLFDAETGTLGFSAVIHDWQQCCPSILPDLRDAFPHARVMLSNNAIAVAYSAFIDKMQASSLPLLVMTIQEGIDAGVILRGGASFPLEAGHIIIDRHGPACKCGNSGCLETFCSTTALFERLRDAGFSVCYQDTYGSGQNEAAMQEVAEAFRRGDRAVAACLQSYCRDLSCAIISIVNLLGVRAVRLGGLIRLLGEPFAALLHQTLDAQFHVITNTQQLELKLFDHNYEDTRRAAVMQTLEAIFSRA